MPVTPEQIKAAAAWAVKACWRNGDLRYKLHATQAKIYEAIHASTQRRHFLCCSRRLGKTYMLVALAFETALKKPGSRILFLAPHAKNAAEIADDTVVQILEDCPKELRPEFKSQIKEYHFPNGSIIRLKGVNSESAQYLRGGAADLVILDECGLMDDLKHVLDDIVAPMTMTTLGRIILATTPARSPGHESAGIYEDLAGKSAVSNFTLLDAPHVSDEVKTEYLLSAGEDPKKISDILAGKCSPETTTAKREYWCQWVTDASAAVVPEFTEEVQKACVVEWPRPEFYDAYVSMDPGFNDRTGVLFGYWDFRNYKLVIEAELLLHKANTQDIADAIKKTQNDLWPDKPPYCSVSDVDLRLMADLYQMHGLVFTSARKEDSEGAINFMRNMVQQREIIIQPNCVNLTRQLRDATWNNRVTDFERSQKDGHYDLVAALKYLCRSVLKTRNPYPDGYFGPGGPGGPGANSFVSPKGFRRSGPRGKLNLHGNTPTGKRLQKASKRRK